jgi:hypothetical protein
LPSITGNRLTSTYVALSNAIGQAYGSKDNYWISTEIDKRVAASYGRVNLDAFGDLDAEASYPIPKVHSLRVSNLGSDSYRSVWTCRSSKYDHVPWFIPDKPELKPDRARTFAADEQFPEDSGCGGFAVLSASPAEPFNTVALILIGLFLSLIAELGIEALRRRRILGP